MLRREISATSVAANLTGFLSNATGATWTLTATNSGDSLAHLVTIRNDAATDHSGKTAILVGTDAHGGAITETLSLPAGTATVTSTLHYLTLTSVTPSATIGGDTMDIGWAAESISDWESLSTKTNATGITCEVTTGTPTYTVQYSLGSSTIANSSSLTNKTADAVSEFATPIAALRVKWTAAGGVKMTALQAGV